MGRPEEKGGTRILKTFAWNNLNRGGKGSTAGGVSVTRYAGFTLLEVMLVVLLLGVVALFVLPRAASFGKADLNRTARQLVGLVGHLASESAATGRVYRIYYHIDRGDYWVTVGQVTDSSIEFVEYVSPLTARRALPEGIFFEDVVTPQQGKVSHGEAFTQFYPVGVDRSLIHLRDKKQRWTLEIHPLTGRVKIHEGYVERFVR